jgi:hypothetical protein
MFRGCRDGVRRNGNAPRSAVEREGGVMIQRPPLSPSPCCMHATDEELSDRRSRTASDTTRKKGKAQDKEAMTQSRSKTNIRQIGKKHDDTSRNSFAPSKPARRPWGRVYSKEYAKDGSSEVREGRPWKSRPIMKWMRLVAAGKDSLGGQCMLL